MVELLKEKLNKTQTENNSVCYETTGNYLLDCFANIGAMRNRSEDDILKIFYKALAEDKLLAVKMLFYVRDIREGLGERRIFKVILRSLALNYPSIVKKNMHLIPEYGRYDDLFVLFDTVCEDDMMNLIIDQLLIDMQSEYPSLLMKWLKSENTSSKESRDIARKLRERLNLSPKEYRRALSVGRNKLRVIERLMSEGRWDEIDFSKITSKNMLQYNIAFIKHCSERFNEYKMDVVQGKQKLNAATLYPYEIIRKLLGYVYIDEETFKNDKQTCELLWKNQPEIIGDKDANALCVVDVSGSMFGRPLEVAISLGLYTAERLNGVYHNHFMTFSDKPTIQRIVGEGLYEKVLNIRKSDFGFNTNLAACFDIILKTAIENKVDKNDLPEKLLIISDMEFDECVMQGDMTIFEKYSKEFQDNGYNLPVVVFWNVDSRKNSMQVKSDNTNVLLVSGLTPNLLKGVLKYNNPLEMMYETLNSERYMKVEI